MTSPSDEEILEFAAMVQRLAEAERINKLELYKPYPKQAVFHQMGANAKERLLMAGNQTGKTWCGAYEMAMHLTGNYPEWWQGRRFTTEIVAIVGSKTAELTRDGVQKYLVGPPEMESDWGTGTIPQANILDRSRRQGVANALDSVSVKHKSGGTSRLLFKSYDQGRQKWQANTAHVVWFDEEPDMEVYSEGCTRTVATGGIIYMTFTPLLGKSSVVLRFLNEGSDDRVTVKMTMEDAEHFKDPKRKAEALSIYPAHERDARASGIPMLGSGRIFMTPEDMVVCEPQEIKKYWAVLGGLDIGMDHPTACVWVAWDKDVDVLYVYHEHRATDYKIAMHASAMRSRGQMIPWAWPHDGNVRDKGSGETIATLFKKEGVNMLHAHATWPEGGYGTEPAVLEIQNREETGRLKYFSNCVNILEERRSYHRDNNGQIVKKEDDLLSALQKCIMMKRFARPYGDVMARGLGKKKPQKFAKGSGFIKRS